jgi:transposase
LPLAAALGPGNENERAHLLPLLDHVRAHGHQPWELWADRGYCSDPLREAVSARGVRPMISRRKRANEPEAANQKTRSGRRGRRTVVRRADPQARGRWVVERTNAWLRRFRRLNTRVDPNSRVYLAYLTLALILILARAL